ncbi:hypothetical protein ACSQ67_022335 [Phaseolus vulgaris]
MSKLIFVFLAFIPLLCTSFSPERPSDRRVLVLLDDFAVKSSHSLFSTPSNLEASISTSTSPMTPKLRSRDTASFGGSVDAAAILDFVDSGHDLIVAADSNASDLIREIAVECGVDFDEDPASMVVDHSGYAVSATEGDHTLIASDDFIKSDAPVLFQGIGHSLNPTNSLVLKALSASPSAFSANPKSKLTSPPSLTGSSISLVSVIQARNNARILISGSLSMFSNRFFRSGVQKAGSPTKHEKSGNEQFFTELSKWVFHERGHLKAVHMQHHKVGEANEPAIYRINDDLEFSVEIFEWSGTSWEPYVADDVQVQFYMMSPYVLKTLSTNGKGRYFTSFKVPDVYGVFQFKVEYEKLGYTSLSLSKQIPVRPFRHNEYERFIPAAYPYYGAAFSMMAGFFIFTAVHLYSK